MCVAAFAWHAHPHWPLVVIGNRDEFHDRPAAPLAAWSDGSGILAGRDLQSGGTWLGIGRPGSSNFGQMALVTNLRGYGLPDPVRISRGDLVARLLRGEPDPGDLQAYNPFNLIHANAKGARFLTNRPQDRRTPLANGIYGLSNGALDEPWAKTVQLKAALAGWLEAGDPSTAALFDALAGEDLKQPGSSPRAPSDIPAEAAETPVFIRNPLYGTRCSTVIVVTLDGRGTIAERRFDRDGLATGETVLGFEWEM
ncbi:MAG: NRDE family protein [Erythrobacter sp.]